MKKIYMLVAGLILGGSTFAQNSMIPNLVKHRAIVSANARHTNGNSASRSTVFPLWIEPVGAVMMQQGIDETGASTGTSQGTFVDVVYMDSTVTQSDGTGTSNVGEMMLGSVLDPTSSNLQPSYLPLAAYSDSYRIDSLAVEGAYVKVTNTIDTLYVWLVWGDSSSSSASFTKQRMSNLWVPPLATMRYEAICPKVTGASHNNGNLVHSASPSSNMMLIKYALQDSDSSQVGSTGVGVKAINIPLAQPANIPAGNIVSCYYTFVPGSVNAANAVCFSFSGGATQTVNGFAGLIWNQTSPAVNLVTDYTNQQIDPTSWCMGIDYFKQVRYAETNFTSADNFVWGDPVTAGIIDYHISGLTTGINELTNNNFALYQNQPNPFTNETTINYELKTASKNVALQIFDVTGVKVFEKVQTNVGTGRYSVNIDNNNLSSGIYFYSLTVDGSSLNKKMVVAK